MGSGQAGKDRVGLPSPVALFPLKVAAGGSLSGLDAWLCQPRQAQGADPALTAEGPFLKATGPAEPLYPWPCRVYRGSTLGLVCP